LALDPQLVIMDEPTTALDVVTQREILGELAELRARFGFAMIFITHDLASARYVSDRIAIMYAGRLVELGSASDVLGAARHPYTNLLRDAAPDPTQRGLARIQAEERGEPPDLTALPRGCAFAPRCSFARDECLVEFPAWRRAGEGHEVRCVLVDEAAT